MERLITTEDGSHSLYSPIFNQQYHSLQGALMESLHIYIQLGLLPQLLEKSQVRIFEMGFGTGLNAYLTWKTADELKKSVSYTSVEAFPVLKEEAEKLNYEASVGKPDFMKLHTSSWSETHQFSSCFKIRKEQSTLQDLKLDGLYDVIYYDAFDPRAQPELWTEEIFTKIAAHTRPGGVLVTYSSKGIVKRALAAAGFEVKRHPGPGRKTHVLRATKIDHFLDPI